MPEAKPTTGTGKPRLDALHGIRIFAALHVVVVHFGAHELDALPRWASQLVLEGRPALTLLFVLSGFVVTYGYGEVLARGDITPRAFWWGRFARIYPLYVGAFVLAAIMATQRRNDFPGSYPVGAILYLVGLQAWWPPYDRVFNEPGWTLSTELAFYVVFPWLVRRALRLRNVHLYAGLAVAWAWGMVLPWWVTRIAPVGTTADPVPYMEALAHRAPFVRVAECVMGVFTGVLFLRAQKRGPFRHGGTLAVAAIVASCALVSQRYELFGPRCDLIIGNVALAPLFCAVIYGLAAGGAPSRLLATRWLVRLGVSSYAIYIFQIPLHDFIQRHVVPRWSNAPGHLLSWIVVLVAFGVLVHEDVEEPLRRAILAHSKRTARR